MIRLCFAPPRRDLEALVTEASLLLELTDEELASRGDAIAEAYEALAQLSDEKPPS